MAAQRPSDAEREHFRRIARANADSASRDERPPASLREMFDRLEALHAALGRFAEAGIDGGDPSELESHLRVMRRLRGLVGDESRRG
jgi:hypothetical protein